MEENVIRQNKATGEWVIFAPSRRLRPHNLRCEKVKTVDLLEHDNECPFCPPNKYPALTPDDNTERYKAGIYIEMKAFGWHEVIIESPKHNQHIAVMSPEDEVPIIIETYHQRYVDLMKEHENMMAIFFRNHGAGAGASLLHPHSQLIVTGMVPHYIRWRESEAERYFDKWGRCVYCDILEFELKESRRILFENNSFISFIPYAADVPFETWIIPKRHAADFSSINDQEKTDLSYSLQYILSMLYENLNDPDYNYIINSSAKYRDGEPQLHWYLQILPRLTTKAGFEIGSGISVNPSLPEKDADFLKEAQKNKL